MPEDAVTMPLIPANKDKENQTKGKKMKESEVCEKIKYELLEFMRTNAKELDYLSVHEKLKEFGERCWCPLTHSVEEEQQVMDNYYFLLGWLESRISLATEQHFTKYVGGTAFSHSFKEVPQETKK